MRVPWAANIRADILLYFFLEISRARALHLARPTAPFGDENHCPAAKSTGQFRKAVAETLSDVGYVVLRRREDRNNIEIVEIIAQGNMEELTDRAHFSMLRPMRT